jgi:iron complex outermembrane receptor protein
VARGARIGLLGNQDIFDTPYSVSSYTSELIKNQQAKTVADVALNDASVEAKRQSGGELVYVRGFNTGGTHSALYDGLPGLAHRRLSHVNAMERVEIIKGPNSLLSGSVGAVGGVVNLVPKRPLDDSITHLTTSYESDSKAGLHADISRRGGTENRFGARVNAGYSDGESTSKNNEEELKEAALALDYLGDKFKAELFVDHSEMNLDGENDIFLVSTTSSIPKAPDMDNDIQQSWAMDTQEFSRGLLRLEYDLTDAWTIHAAYGATTFDQYRIRTLARNLNESGDFTQIAQQQGDEIDSQSGSADITGAFDTGSISHQVSLQFLTSTDDNYRLSGAISGYSVSSNIYHPVQTARPTFSKISGNPPKLSSEKATSTAITDTLGFMDEKILLTLGARQQQIKTESFNTTTGERTSKYDESATTPSIGILVHALTDLSLYVNYIEALETGPTAPDGTTNAGEVFAPSKTKQIEFGSKWDLGELGLTAAVFQIERPTGITDTNNHYDLGGEQRHRGVEFNAFGNLRPNLRILGGVTYLDAELTKTADATLDGNTPVLVPEWAAVLNVEWDMQQIPGLTFTGRANHTGSRFAADDNSAKLPSYEIYDIGARYQTEIGNQLYTFQANIDNLLNENYWDISGNRILWMGEPRSINLSMRVEF